MSQYGKPAAVCDTCIVVLSDLSRSRPGSQWWIQDLSACVQNILLQAVEEDLGAVWMGFYPNESRVTDAKALLELPEHIVPFAVIALGHPAQLPPPEDRFDSARVHFEHY